MVPIVLLFIGIGCNGVLGSSVKFPSKFQFGAATSAFQLEGAWNEDGKGPSIWDAFCHEHPQKCENTNGDVSADHYHHVVEDVMMLKELGVDFYRFSISWPRILPNGTSNYINQKGVDFYLKIFKLLKENNIKPLVTIYHWDLPNNLAEMGGWLNPLMPVFFEDYSRVVFSIFGDYAKEWATINEMWNSCVGGMESGGFAPGLKLYGVGVYICSYTQIIAHARAYRLYEREFKHKQQGKVGVVFATNWFQPSSNSSEDLAAVERGMEFQIGLYAHPIFYGDYPEIVKQRVDFRSKQAGFPRSRLIPFTEEEKIMVKGSIDFFGVNYYSAYKTSSLYTLTDWPKNTSLNLDVGVDSHFTDSPYPQSKSDSSFYNTPWALGKILSWICDHYNHPLIYITENGFSTKSGIKDADRVNYLKHHLEVVLDAVTTYDAKIQKYTVWTFLDDFEWGSYKPRFGLVEIDFDVPNRTRTPRDSFYWYKELIKKQCFDC